MSWRLSSTVESMPDAWLRLPPVPSWSRSQQQIFLEFAAALADRSGRVDLDRFASRPSVSNSPALLAALLVISDLVSQGWVLRVEDARVLVKAAEVEADALDEKERVRRQELLKRDEQLSTPSVRRFVADMERPREYNGRFVSIFNLMRDGADLAAALGDLRQGDAAPHPSEFATLIDPYFQVVQKGDRCRYTGLRLMDVWRYFRHTWTNQYTSTPGRTMLLLVRDRAAPSHPVIGIAALGSAIVQIRERDDWIGWQPETFLNELSANPTLRAARWISDRLERGLSEIYVADLIEDGLYWPTLWEAPTEEGVQRLAKEAECRRRDHHRFVRRSDLKTSRSSGDDAWTSRAESDLFRSKRCLALAELLRARAALGPYLYPKPSRDGLRRALADPQGRRAISGLVRRAKAESVGTEIADLIVCGALPPYNALLGGKLVSMLAVSPAVVRAYSARYADHASEIASSIAGRPIRRRSNLVYVGTTSLYGSVSSQYNRVRIPGHLLGGTGGIEFRRLGKSKSFGTSHLSNDTITALVQLAEQERSGIRVNSIFGEGVNPKLRKIRAAFDILGWPSDALLQHGRRRIIYGVPLVGNLLPYLLGIEEKPRYLYRRNVRDDSRKVTAWWFERWLRPRVGSAEVLEKVAEHTLKRPVRHGARVVLPPPEETT